MRWGVKMNEEGFVFPLFLILILLVWLVVVVGAGEGTRKVKHKRFSNSMAPKYIVRVRVVLSP